MIAAASGGTLFHLVGSGRDAGVAERAGLENRCAFTGTEGSNPSLSASMPPGDDAICRPPRGALESPRPTPGWGQIPRESLCWPPIASGRGDTPAFDLESLSHSHVDAAALAMKFAVIIPDGAADEPQPTLKGLTPLQAAHTPAMDRIARLGQVGRAVHVPDTLPSGSDVGMMNLVGYDPLTWHTGRAPLEAAARGVALGDDDWAIRCNLVTVIGGAMESFNAHQVKQDHAEDLLQMLQDDLGPDSPWEFHAGVGYRNLLVYRSRDAANGPMFTRETNSIPPHDVTDQQVEGFLPTGPGADALRGLMNRSRSLFTSNVNPSQANQVWLWGHGRRPAVTPFVDRFGVRGAVVTAVDLVRGLGRLVGWDVVAVAGATGYLDTDYAAKGRAAIKALENHDLVVVHVEATDAASHEGDVLAKVEAIERIDEWIVAPLHRWLEDHGDHRLLVSPDHPTLLRTKTHSHGPVPIAACGTGLAVDSLDAYHDIAAEASSLVFDPGCLVMPWLLGRESD